MMTGYKNKHGQILFVSAGIGGDNFATYTKKPGGSLKRFCSPLLPVRTDRNQAEWDLQKYARINKLKKVDIQDYKFKR